MSDLSVDEAAPESAGAADFTPEQLRREIHERLGDDYVALALIADLVAAEVARAARASAPTLDRDHSPTLVLQDGEAGDLCRCTCGEQGFDYQQGRKWFAAHLAAVRASASTDD